MIYLNFILLQINLKYFYILNKAKIKINYYKNVTVFFDDSYRFNLVKMGYIIMICPRHIQ